MDHSCYEIRTMTRSEIDMCVDWARREGWNPGLHDAEAFYRADPEGFLVGLLDGRPIASISAVRYGDDFGFIGFYIVEPQYRGHGYGLAIWEAAMQRLSGRVIGLDGVVEQQPNYRKSGFRFAYNNVRYQGAATASESRHEGIVALNKVPLNDLLAYDRPFFAQKRDAFLASWVSLPGSVALAAVSDGHLCGYGVIRACHSGYKVGPLFADDPQTAQRLFAALMASVEPGAQIQLDIPAINPAALELVERHSMTPVFETARMYTGAAPSIDIDRMYGITSFELG